MMVPGQGLLDGGLAGVRPCERGPPVGGARGHPLGQTEVAAVVAAPAAVAAIQLG